MTLATETTQTHTHTPSHTQYAVRQRILHHYIFAKTSPATFHTVL